MQKNLMGTVSGQTRFLEEYIKNKNIEENRFPRYKIKTESIEFNHEGLKNWIINFAKMINSGDYQHPRENNLWVYGETGRGKSTIIKFLRKYFNGYAIPKESHFTTNEFFDKENKFFFVMISQDK